MGVRYFQKSNVDHIGNTANVFQWKESFQNMNINDVVHIFTRTATSIFNNFIPHEIITCDYRDQFWIDDSIRAMYKTRNTGTGNGMRETRGIGGMLYSLECPQTFWGISSNIPGNVAKHSGECCQIFRGISPNIPLNVAKHSWEYSRKIQRIFENNLQHVVKHFVESMKGFG